MVWLIVYLHNAKINKYGFIESPYKRVKNAIVEDKIEYLSAMEEGKYTIAQANSKVDKNGKNYRRFSFMSPKFKLCAF